MQAGGPVHPSLVGLFPRPQRLRVHEGTWVLPAELSYRAPEGAAGSVALEWLGQALSARGHQLARALEPGVDAALVFRIEPIDFGERGLDESSAELVPSQALAQGYTLTIGAGAISISASGAAGVQHALCTLLQLIALARGSPGQLELPALAIADWPDFGQRGVMLDVSRDKVPKLSTLYALIDRLASWKLNELQLYMEHTFAYAGHAEVWRGASPFTPEEIRALDAYCAERHVELVPNQNSFGHMHRWLVHEPYRALAECPDGFDHPWNWSGEPYGLCATDPASLVFLEGLYDDLLPNFTSRMFNVGLDETIDLGAGRSKAACEARGTERVYLDFLEQVHARVRSRGHVMQFWGDIIVKRPDLISELPRDAIALEWGYEAEHPFAEHLALFKSASLRFYVCPGTSSWNSIAGRTDNAIENLARAAREGRAAGAAGLLITDWGDHGHLQPLSVSYLGLLLGAGFAWNVSDAERPFELDVPRLLDTHVFCDSAGVLGRVAYELGNTYKHAGSLRTNASVLFWSLLKPERLFSPPGVTRETLENALAHVERVAEPLARARPATGDGPLLLRELGWARDLLAFACRLGIARCSLRPDAPLAELLPEPRAELALELEELIQRHRLIWCERNRDGGLDDSARRLEQTLAALRPGPR